MITDVCHQCGGTFRAYPSRCGKYCSRKCANKAKAFNEEFKRKRSEYMHKLFSEHPEKNPCYGKVAWNKGLTKETDDRVSTYALSIKKAHEEGKMKDNYKKISQSLRCSFRSGKIQAWSKGLTRETSESIAKAAEKIAETLRGKYVGEKNPFWKGGYEPYYGPNWREQRRKALERDNNTCRKCGSKERVEVNHIIPFRKFGRARYLEANKLENLLTLCIHCHRRFEGKIEELVAVVSGAI